MSVGTYYLEFLFASTAAIKTDWPRSRLIEGLIARFIIHHFSHLKLFNCIKYAINFGLRIIRKVIYLASPKVSENTVVRAKLEKLRKLISKKFEIRRSAADDQRHRDIDHLDPRVNKDVVDAEQWIPSEKGALRTTAIHLDLCIVETLA